MKIHRSVPSLVIGIVCFVLGFTVAYFPSGTQPGSTKKNDESLARDLGASLFQTHCTLCHGNEGLGDGWAAPLLLPPARDFSKAKFLLTSTDNSAPSPEDIVRVLKRGIPGSAMPSFSWMSDEELLSIESHVRRLAIDGHAAHLRREDGPKRTFARTAQTLAEEAMTTGPVILPPPCPEPTPEILTRGQEVYVQNCAVCHGKDGHGERPDTFWTEDEEYNRQWSRDFHVGVLKGGAHFENLYWRIQSGMRASAMHEVALDTEDDAIAVVLYVQSLLPLNAHEELVHQRGKLIASKRERIPGTAEEREWEGVEPMDVILSPLHWHDDAVTHVQLSAVHDSSNIAIRMSWKDATRDDQVLDPELLPDSAALQFHSDPSPPLMGMGNTEHPAMIWHWTAFRREALVGMFDLLDSPPHRAPGHLGDRPTSDSPFYVPAISLTEASKEAEFMKARGPSKVESAREPVRVKPQWRDGSWSLVFVHPIKSESGNSLSLVEGHSIPIACAIWNGSAGQKGALKSISIWQQLDIRE